MSNICFVHTYLIFSKVYAHIHMRAIHKVNGSILLGEGKSHRKPLKKKNFCALKVV